MATERDFDFTAITSSVLADVERGLLAFGLEIEADMVQEARSSGMDDTGAFTQSIYAELDKSGAMPAVEVGPSIEYADFAVFGRKPGKRPPLEPLRRWARRKLGVSEEDAASVAHAIATVIGRRGTKGQPQVYEGPNARAQSAAPARIASILDASLARHFGGGVA